MTYQCGRCGLTRTSGQAMGLAIPQCTCPWEFDPPASKPWVGLTDEQINKLRHMVDWTAGWSYIDFARAIEAAHGIKEDV